MKIRASTVSAAVRTMCNHLQPLQLGSCCKAKSATKCLLQKIVCPVQHSTSLICVPRVPMGPCRFLISYTANVSHFFLHPFLFPPFSTHLAPHESRRPAAPPCRAPRNRGLHLNATSTAVLHAAPTSPTSATYMLRDGHQ